MAEIISIFSSRTSSQQSVAENSLTSSSFLKKKPRNSDKPLENPRKAGLLQRRRTLKLKSQPFEDEVSRKDEFSQKLRDFFESSTKKLDFSQKRRISEKFALPGESLRQNPKKSQGNSGVSSGFASKIRLFDSRRREILEFRCFQDETLGFSKEISKLIVGTRQDNDVETDSETLKFYVKRCEKDLLEAVSKEKARKREKLEGELKEKLKK